MFTEMPILTQPSGGGGVAYKETATAIGWSGNMYCCECDMENQSATVGVSGSGTFLTVGYASTTMHIKVLSTVQGSIEVDYCSFDGNNQPTYSSGTFSAGDTVTSHSFSGSVKAGIWAAVKG